MKWKLQKIFAYKNLTTSILYDAKFFLNVFAYDSFFNTNNGEIGVFFQNSLYN